MASTSLKVTLRTLYRDKLYAAINLAGLSLAIACCLILGLYLRSELTYDRHHVNHERIYRLVNEFYIGERIDRFAHTSAVIGEMLQEQYPVIQDYVRFRNLGQFVIRVEDQSYVWQDTYLADDNVFDVFTHEIIAGDPKTALVEPSTAAVSRTFAERYFGDRNPVGEIFTIDNGAVWKITAVFEDLPENTHLKYDVLFSYNGEFFANPTEEQQRRQQLFGINDFTYLVMPEGYDIAEFPPVAQAFFDRHMAQNPMGATWKAWLQPLASIHLYSDFPNDLPRGNPYYLYGFAAVSIFILLVACINYINLATARATKRAKEVGLRKILGASKKALSTQFLAESLVLALAALVLGAIAAGIMFNATPIADLLGKPLALDLVGEPTLLVWMLGITAAVGLLSGLYPAVYLAAIRPTAAVGSSTRAGSKTLGFRQFLVLVQFTITIAVIAATLLMASQMRYIADFPLGFAKENRLMITLRGVDLIKQIPVLRNELVQHPQILGVTASQSMMGRGFPINIMQIENNTGSMVQTTLNHMPVADDFIEVMDMQVVAGRGFSAEMADDATAALIVNEALVAQNGWDEPLGKRIQLGPRTGTVIGVVRDFNFRSLKDTVAPFMIYQFQDQNLDSVPAAVRGLQTRLLVVNIAGGRVGETLEYLRGVFARVDPDHPFEYQFLDESLDRLYLSEQRLLRLIAIFGGICIFVACLGVFGLAAFTTEQRTREIGVRKVHGASTAQVIALLARNVLALIGIGAVIASLAAYLAIDRWLLGFAYRVEINPVVFVIAAALALLVAYATVALQSYRAARANPIHALRYE